jgi:hypothetical protein
VLSYYQKQGFVELEVKIEEQGSEHPFIHKTLESIATIVACLVENSSMDWAILEQD